MLWRGMDVDQGDEDGPPEPRIEWRDENGEAFEHRTEILASTECDRCGGEVLLEAETESWEEGDDGRWHHESYGPAMGVCCDLLYADWWEGTFAFHLPASQPEPSGDSAVRRER